MATTYYKLSEQIIRILKGSDRPVSIAPHPLEVKEMIGQVINQLLKVEGYNSLNDRALVDVGDIVPHNLIIATYDNVAVATYKNDYSSLTLPAMPVALPKGMGLFHIGGNDDPFNSYIPIPAGLYQMVSEEPLITDLLGQIGYERHGSLVVFTEDLTARVPAITSVSLKLIVYDLSTYSDYDMLPVPADMEATIISEVLKLLGVQQAPDNKVDPVSEQGKPQQ